MELILHSPSTFFSKSNPRLLPNYKPHLRSLSTPTQFSIKSQDSSSTEPTISNQSADDASSTPAPPPQIRNSTTGLGFGSSPTNSNPATPKKKQQQKGKRERASIIRREPVEKPKFIAQQDESKLKEQGQNEKAFLLAWLGLGSIIFVQGILLSVSGFLPEGLDDLCVKYVYPSFTPTVLFFFAGTVAYGVSKYIQNEKSNTPN